MNSRNFFAELKRRNVYKVAVAYAVVGWLLVQVATQVFPFFDIPNWTVRFAVLAIVIGFPIALVIAWAFELTPEGLKRTEEADLTTSPSRKSYAWIYVVIVGAAFSIGLFLVGRYTANRSDDSKRPQKSIAVLPFASLSEDKSNAYFAEGIQDEILGRLSKIADLKVISRTSTLQYQSKPGNLSEIAKQLGVAHVLEGSVQKVGDQVRVSVQLINAQNDSHVWADTYDRKLTDILGVESEIAKSIAEQLQTKFTGGEQQALAVKPTNNADAYDAYLRGLAAEGQVCTRSMPWKTLCVFTNRPSVSIRGLPSPGAGFRALTLWSIGPLTIPLTPVAMRPSAPGHGAKTPAELGRNSSGAGHLPGCCAARLRASQKHVRAGQQGVAQQD